jgi:uncharacterized RDD family membrane protein YckC
MACFLYEGVLLFGVIMMVGLLYGVLTQQRHALVGATGLQATLFAALGAYFVYFWGRRGQTLAMLTWHIRLVSQDGEPVTYARATLRYLLCWMWFIPALAIVHAWGLTSGWVVFGAVAAGILGYASLARLRRDRQYWHDVVCRTRLETWHPPHRQPKNKPLATTEP